MGGEEAKTRSLDNCFKEFYSTGGPRNQAVSGENIKSKWGVFVF